MLRLFGKKDKGNSNKTTTVVPSPASTSSSSLNAGSEPTKPQRPSPSSSHATIGGKKKSGVFARPPPRSESLPPVPPLLVTHHASATPTTSVSSEASVLLTPEDWQDTNQPLIPPSPAKPQQPWKSWITSKKKQDSPSHLQAPAVQSRPVSMFAPLPKALPRNSPLEDSDNSEEEDESEDSDSDWEEMAPRKPARLPTAPTQQPLHRPTKASINLRAITKNSLATPHGLPPLLYFPSVNLFPRSSNPSSKLPSPQTMQSEMFKKRLLRKLNARQLTAAEAASIAPFASRSKPQPPMPSPKPNAEEVVSDLGKVAGDGYSRGLRNWIQRPCFEERTVIWLAGQERPQRVTTRPDLALADLEFSTEVEGLAGLYLAEAAEPPAVTHNLPALPSPVTPTGPATRKEKRGVRFSVQVDQQESERQDAMPLGFAMAKQREREERQKRMLEERQLRQRMAQEEKEKEEKRLAAEDRRQKKYAEMIAASRTRRELQRAPGSLGETHAIRELHEQQRLPPPPPLFGSEDSRSQPRTPADSPASKKKPLPSETAEIPTKVPYNNPRRESAPSMSRMPYANPMVMMPYSLSATSLPMQIQQPWAMQPGFMYDPMLAASMAMDPAQLNAMFTGEGLRPWVNGQRRTGSSTPPSSSSPGMTPPGSFAGSSSEDIRQSTHQKAGYFGPQGSAEDLRHGKSGSSASNYERGRSGSSRPRAPSSTRSASQQRGMTVPPSRESGHHRESTFNGRDTGKWVQHEDVSKYVGSLGRSHNSRPMPTAVPPMPSPLKPSKPSHHDSQDSHRPRMPGSGSMPAISSSSSSRGHLPLPNSFRTNDMSSRRSTSDGNLAPQSRPSGLRNSIDGRDGQEIDKRPKPQQPPPTAYRTASSGYVSVPSKHSAVPSSWNPGTLNTPRTVVQ